MTVFKTPLFFRFVPRWKEKTVVTSNGGSSVLPFWMGRPTVELPKRERWPEVAPDWTRDHWDTLHRALEPWCADNGSRLEISENAQIWRV